jgi:hypothetical protein
MGRGQRWGVHGGAEWGLLLRSYRSYSGATILLLGSYPFLPSCQLGATILLLRCTIPLLGGRGRVLPPSTLRARGWILEGMICRSPLSSCQVGWVEMG